MVQHAAAVNIAIALNSSEALVWVSLRNAKWYFWEHILGGLWITINQSDFRSWNNQGPKVPLITLHSLASASSQSVSSISSKSSSPMFQELQTTYNSLLLTFVLFFLLFFSFCHSCSPTRSSWPPSKFQDLSWLLQCRFDLWTRCQLWDF